MALRIDVQNAQATIAALDEALAAMNRASILAGNAYAGPVSMAHVALRQARRAAVLYINEGITF